MAQYLSFHTDLLMNSRSGPSAVTTARLGVSTSPDPPVATSQSSLAPTSGSSKPAAGDKRRDGKIQRQAAATRKGNTDTGERAPLRPLTASELNQNADIHVETGADILDSVGTGAGTGATSSENARVASEGAGSTAADKKNKTTGNRLYVGKSRTVSGGVGQQSEHGQQHQHQLSQVQQTPQAPRGSEGAASSTPLSLPKLSRVVLPLLPTPAYRGIGASSRIRLSSGSTSGSVSSATPPTRRRATRILTSPIGSGLRSSTAALTLASEAPEFGDIVRASGHEAEAVSSVVSAMSPIAHPPKSLIRDLADEDTSLLGSGGEADASSEVSSDDPFSRRVARGDPFAFTIDSRTRKPSTLDAADSKSTESPAVSSHSSGNHDESMMTTLHRVQSRTRKIFDSTLEDMQEIEDAASVLTQSTKASQDKGKTVPSDEKSMRSEGLGTKPLQNPPQQQQELSVPTPALELPPREQVSSSKPTQIPLGKASTTQAASNVRKIPKRRKRLLPRRSRRKTGTSAVPPGPNTQPAGTPLTMPSPPFSTQQLALGQLPQAPHIIPAHSIILLNGYGETPQIISAQSLSATKSRSRDRTKRSKSRRKIHSHSRSSDESDSERSDGQDRSWSRRRSRRSRAEADNDTDSSDLRDESSEDASASESSSSSEIRRKRGLTRGKSRLKKHSAEKQETSAKLSRRPQFHSDEELRHVSKDIIDAHRQKLEMRAAQRALARRRALERFALSTELPFAQEVSLEHIPVHRDEPQSYLRMQYDTPPQGEAFDPELPPDFTDILEELRRDRLIEQQLWKTIHQTDPEDTMIDRPMHVSSMPQLYANEAERSEFKTILDKEGSMDEPVGSRSQRWEDNSAIVEDDSMNIVGTPTASPLVPKSARRHSPNPPSYTSTTMLHSPIVSAIEPSYTQHESVPDTGDFIPHDVGEQGFEPITSQPLRTYLYSVFEPDPVTGKLVQKQLVQKIGPPPSEDELAKLRALAPKSRRNSLKNAVMKTVWNPRDIQARTAPIQTAATPPTRKSAASTVKQSRKDKKANTVGDERKAKRRSEH